MDYPICWGIDCSHFTTEAGAYEYDHRFLGCEITINSIHFWQWSSVTGLGSLFIFRLKLKANYSVCVQGRAWSYTVLKCVVYTVKAWVVNFKESNYEEKMVSVIHTNLWTIFNSPDVDVRWNSGKNLVQWLLSAFVKY